MTEEKGLFKEFAGRWGRELSRLWDDMPEAKRRDLLDAVRQLPGDHRGWRSLIEKAIEHVRVVAGNKQRVAIVGPANVGKSTLYNQLIRSRRDRALVSAVPGTTRGVQDADAGLFVIADTPGADAIGAVGEEEKRKAVEAAMGADVVVLMFDASHGIREPERKLFTEIVGLDKPTVTVLNKMDLIGRERAQVVGRAAAALGLEVDQALPVSAKKGDGVEDVLLAIAKSEPEIISALAAALPAYRWRLAQLAIGQAASTSAAIALTPLPLLDFVPLVGVQSAMVLAIARIYQERITLARARELLAAFGAGFLGRTLFHELVKLGGPPAWMLAAAVAAGTTAAIGYGAALWFERGEKLSSIELRRIAQRLTGMLVDELRSLGKKRPSRPSLRERVLQALKESEIPLPADDNERE